MVKHEKTTTLSENVLELWGFISFLFRASCCLGEPGSPEESDCGETDQKAGREPAQRRVSFLSCIAVVDITVQYDASPDVIFCRDCRETCQKLTDWILTSDAEYLRYGKCDRIFIRVTFFF